jgi:predicted site-specific integrase-resolvase
MIDAERKVFYIPDICRMAGVHPNTPRNWVRQGRLSPPIRVGGRPAWPREVIERFLGMSGGQAPAPTT